MNIPNLAFTLTPNLSHLNLDRRAHPVLCHSDFALKAMHARKYVRTYMHTRTRAHGRTHTYTLHSSVLAAIQSGAQKRR